MFKVIHDYFILLLKNILIALTILLLTSKSKGGVHLHIEEFNDITIAYMRREGPYGLENKSFMEKFKSYLNQRHLLEKSVILGIALDNPSTMEADKLRYDVGIIVEGHQKIGLKTRKIPDGLYAIFEVPHTEKGVTEFWNQLEQLTNNLSVDKTKSVIERYSFDKVKNHLCEFCVPIIKTNEI